MIMKKIYLSILSLAIIGTVSAQVKQTGGPVKKTNGNFETKKPTVNTNTNESKVLIWSNDFSNASDWGFTNTSVPALDFNWTNDVNAVPAAGPVTMSSAANGYITIDSDAAGQSANQNADATYQGATVIDLSSYPNVVLEFEHHYRTYLDTRTVSVSTDAGATWTDYVVTDGSEANTNVEGLYQVNISAAAGGASNVLIKFNYIGSWGWHWAIDDVRILSQPDNDIQMLTAWVSGENNEGAEYGRTPLTQLDANYLVGAQVFNFGALDQTNLSMTADFGTWSSNSTEPSLLSGDTVIMESTETPTLALGIYDGTYEVVSAEETGGADFGNNGYLRSFEVTDDVYSIDGIDVHPAAELELGSLGTDSWTDGSGEDGLICAAMYHIKATMQVEALQIMLANGSTADAEINVKFIDTANFFNDDMTAFAQSNIHLVTAAEVAAGMATVYFPSLVTLNPGAYMAAVELYSNGGSSPVRVLDDITVEQPWYSSMIYIPADAAYSNGTAFGIRIKAGTVGIDENTLEGVSVYPNPSEGVINVTNTNNENNSIEVLDVTGKVVYQSVVNTATSIDLSSNGTGVYFVKVSNENGSIVEKVVIK